MQTGFRADDCRVCNDFPQILDMKMQSGNDNDSVLAIEISNDGTTDVMPNAEDGSRDGSQRIGGEMKCRQTAGQS